MRKKATKNNHPNPKDAMYFEGIPLKLRRAFKAKCVASGTDMKAALVNFMHEVVDGSTKLLPKNGA